MASALSAVSFLCAVPLACLLPAYWSSRNIAMLALIWWLIICNIIQGVNAVLWAGSVEVKVAAWCDIGTKLLLGARVALPAACICLSSRVRHLPATGDGRGGIGVLSFDLMLCIIVPIVYMVLHVIVQDHRFDLTKDFGCSASVFASIPAFILVWLPPLIFSTIAVVLTCITTYSGYLRGFMNANLRVSSGRYTFSFIRPLFRSFLIALLFLASSSFSLHAALTNSRLLPWTSWDAVHAQLSHVNVISHPTRLELRAIQVVWWMIPVSSFVPIVLFLLNLARGSREDSTIMPVGYRDMVWRAGILLTGKNEARPLSCASSVMDLRPPMLSKQSSDTLLSIHPMDPDSTRSRCHVKVQLAPLSILGIGSKSVSLPASIASDGTDTSFAQSAMSYLESPVGRAAISSMPRPSSIFRPANVPGILPDVPLPSYTTGSPHIPVLGDDSHRATPRRRPSSILSGPWPRPPSSIPSSPAKSIVLSPISSMWPPSPPPVLQRPRPPSSSSVDVSVVSSTSSASPPVADPMQALHDSPTLPHFPPFSDTGIPTGQAMETMSSSRHARRMHSRDAIPQVTRNLSLFRGREKRPEGLDAGVIYMTVVQETV